MSYPSNDKPSFNYALAMGDGFSDKMSWFIEYFGNVNTEDQGIDLGIIYLINKTMQVDFSSGISLGNTDSKFVEVGFSFRLPY